MGAGAGRVGRRPTNFVRGEAGGLGQVLTVQMVMQPLVARLRVVGARGPGGAMIFAQT